MAIGIILYNISNGHQDGLDLWREFSKRCRLNGCYITPLDEDKYDENALNYHWKNMPKKDIGICSLKYYAKTDNLEEYRKLNN